MCNILIIGDSGDIGTAVAWKQKLPDEFISDGVNHSGLLGKDSPTEAESLECSISQQGQESWGSYFLKLECHFRTCMCMCVHVVCYFSFSLCIMKKPYTAVWFPTAFVTNHRFCLYHGSMFSSSIIQKAKMPTIFRVIYHLPFLG